MINTIADVGNFDIEDADSDGEYYVHNVHTGFGFYVTHDELTQLRDALNNALEHLNARTDHPIRR